MFIRTVKTGAIMLVALGVVGCSSASTPPSQTAGAHAAAATKGAPGGTGADVNACSFITIAQAATDTGHHFSAADPSTPAPGQDFCTYKNSEDGSDLVITVYQPNSGVTYPMMVGVLQGAGKVQDVSSQVGMAATVGAIELDAKAPGNRLIAVEGAGGTLTGNWAGAVAITKAVIAGLH
jgi:hypothetical protein